MIGFCFTFPHFPIGYLFQRLRGSRSYSLKEHEAPFLKRKFDFFCSSWDRSVWFVVFFLFCFRLNIFTGKTSNLLLPFMGEAAEGRELWILINWINLGQLKKAIAFNSLQSKLLGYYSGNIIMQNVSCC